MLQTLAAVANFFALAPKHLLKIVRQLVVLGQEALPCESGKKKAQYQVKVQYQWTNEGALMDGRGVRIPEDISPTRIRPSPVGLSLNVRVLQACHITGSQLHFSPTVSDGMRCQL